MNGRKGRRVVCVTSKDGLRYTLYDMDSSHEEEEEGERETDDPNERNKGSGMAM